MTDYSEFFLASPPSVVKLDCLEIAHTNFSQAYRIVRNAPDGVTVTHETDSVEWIWDASEETNVADFGNITGFERTDAHSYGCWFSTTNPIAGYLFFKQDFDNTRQGPAIFVGGMGGQVFFNLNNATPGTNDMSTRTNGNFGDGALHSLVVTYGGGGGSTVTFYVDGAAVPMTVVQDSLSDSIVNTLPLLVGNDLHGFPFDGRIRNAAQWDTELSAGDAADFHAAGPAGSLAALDPIWWVKFDGDDTAGVNGLNDRAGSNDGTASFSPTGLGTESFDYAYYPARILPLAARDDMVQSLSVTLGDVGDVIATEIARLWDANALDTRPTVTYRCFRSDDLSAAIHGPIQLEIVNVTTTKEGASFEAQAPELNATRTGERYDVERFPMLRGFF